MTVQLVDTSPEATALRSASLQAENGLYDLSFRAGGLAALLELVAGNTERLDAPEVKAIAELADIAKRIESGIGAISERLEKARTDCA